MPAPKRPKSVLVALKIDAETASALEALPNKSEFIREALRARLDDVCPLCGGSGRRPPAGIPQPGRRHLHVMPRAVCQDCGREAGVVEEVESRERVVLLREVERLRAFLSFGDFFCGPCFERARECERCGHRVAGRPADRRAHACAR